jgi:hypothetical protein
VKISRTFLLAFQRQHVLILLKNVGAVSLDQSADGEFRVSGAAAVMGYVIDHCDNFLYLGNKEGTVIEKAVSIVDISSISLHEEEEEVSLITAEGPKSDMEIN